VGRYLTPGLLVFVMCTCAEAQELTDILPNGSFEKADGSLPAGWVRVEGTLESVLYSDDRPRTGARCIKLESDGGRAGVRAREPLPVEPGETYRLRQYHRIEASNLEGGQALSVQAYFLGDDGERLNRRVYPPATAHTGGYARVSEGWRMREVDFTVPEPARAIEVYISLPTNFRGLVAVDDVQVLRIPQRIFSPPPGSLAFDFVAEDTKPTPGFTAVPFDRSFDEAGDFGWKLRNGQPLYAGTRCVQPAYPTQLHGHSVRRATFSCMLPDGDYACSLFMGAIWRTNVDQMNHVVEVNGEVVVGEQREFNALMDEEYFRYSHATLVTPDDLERKGLAVYDRYIRPRYRRHDFTVTVTGGRMDVQALSGFMSGMIITPAVEAEAHAAAVAELDAQLAEEFASNWAELLPVDPSRGAYRGDYQPTAEDQERGYVVYRRHWMQAVEHDSRPDPEDVSTELAVFATPGEYEPLTFTVWPLEDLHNVTITPSDLRGEDGAVLPADIVRVWYLQQKHERRARPCTAYYIRGTFLPDWGEERELFGGIAQRCWLSLKLPEQAAPGIYRGEVEFAPSNAPPTTLALSLRVLPFELSRPQRLHVMRRAANAVTIPYPSEYPVADGDIRNRQYYCQAAIDDLYGHGFAPEFTAWWRSMFSRERGVVEWDKPNSLSGPPRQFLQLIEDSGFGRQGMLLVDGAPISDRVLASFGAGSDAWSTEDTRNWLRDLSATLAAEGFDKVYMHITAEESHTLPTDGGTDAWIRYHRFITENRDEWPNLFTCHSCNTAWGQPIALREADMAFLGMFHGVGNNGEEQVEMARSTGKPFGLYGCRGRLVPGYYLWKAGASATFHEFYGPYWGIPNSDWDNPQGMDSHACQVMNEAPGWCNVTYSPTGRMIGSWFWEEMREGVDDDSYMHTLEALIEESADSQAPAVVEARAYAREVLASTADYIDLDISPAALGPLTYRPFAPEDFDGLRWRVALAAARLLAAADNRGFAVRPAAAGEAPLLHRVRYEPDVAVTSEATRPIIEPFVVQARELPGPITLDGTLDEPCYREQAQAAEFIELSTSRPATPRTEVYVLADGETIYLGIRCHEPRMSGLRLNEDEDSEYIWNDDVVEVFLDPKHSHQSYYHFGVTANGTRSLAWHDHVRQQGAADSAQPVAQLWEARTQLEDEAWTVEMAIPLAEAQIEGTPFGMSVCRTAPQHGMFSCWTLLPKSSYHQPEANADVYLPGARTIMERLTTGHLTAGGNRASVWVRETEGAAPVAIEMSAPDGTVQDLAATKQAEADGLVRYDAPYDLGKDLGTCVFSVRAGAAPLGVYRGEYASAFFNASLRRGFIWSQGDGPTRADIELLVPPGTPPAGFGLRLRVLGDAGTVKEATIGDLQSRRITAFVSLDDLPLGVYDLEIALLDSDARQLKRTLSEFEILPALLSSGGRQ